MDIEQLKLIIQAVQGLAGETSHVVMWWMAVKFGVSLLSEVSLAFIVCFCVWYVARTWYRVTTGQVDTAEALSRAVRDAYYKDVVTPELKNAVLERIHNYRQSKK